MGAVNRPFPRVRIDLDMSLHLEFEDVYHIEGTTRILTYSHMRDIEVRTTEKAARCVVCKCTM